MSRPWPTGRSWQPCANGADPDHIVRVIEYTIFTVSDEGEEIGETITLVTSLLDPGRFPAADFPDRYHQRWESETLYDAVKTTIRGGTAVRFRSTTPGGVAQEAWALLLVYQALSDLICRAAGADRLDPDRISFTTALNLARRSIAHTGEDFSP